jgi:sugar-specific transcriptional regulator TrmB
MAVDKDHKETLIKLGLSINEAKVYLGVLDTGVATVRVISKSANVGREDVYRVLPSLLEIGLVKKHVESPAKYEAITPEDAIKTLLTRREEENKRLEFKAAQFLITCHGVAAANDVADERTVVVAREPRTGVDPELMRLLKNAKKTVDFTTTNKLFSTAFNEPGLGQWIDELCNAADRGVKCRMVMERPKEVMPFSKMDFSVTKRFLIHPNFSFRYVCEPPDCVFLLFDNQASCIETSSQTATKMMPYMITNNLVFATLSRAYFDLLWSSGEEIMQNFQPDPELKPIC